MCGRRFVVAVVLMVVTPSAYLDADIFRWDNGQLIPGTTGITPGPGVNLSSDNGEWNTESQNLRFADLSGRLNLSFARFRRSWLDNANLSGANLTNAYLESSTLTDANLSGATVTGANFYRYWDGQQFQGTGLSQAQLASTASYQAKSLMGIGLGGNDLTGWDFSGQDLTNAQLFYSTLTDANLRGAVVTGADFSATTSGGFNKTQLMSTASYQARNLTGIRLNDNDLTGWDFSQQNVSGAQFAFTNLTKEQLYSTASFQSRNMSGMSLHNNDLSDWDFTGQNLTNGTLSSSLLEGTIFTDAVVALADFWGTTSEGFTQDQLASTSSYKVKDLVGIDLGANDLTGWNLAGQNLTNSNLSDSTLTDTDLSAADLRAASVDLTGATIVNTIWPNGMIHGLILADGQSLQIRDHDGEKTRNKYISSPPLPISVQDHMSVSTGSVLRLVFESAPWDSLIAFEPNIPVQLGGSLELRFTDDVDIATQIGRTLYIFDWTGVNPTGQFHVASPYAWDLTDLYNTGEVTLLGVPEPSTFIITFAALSSLVGRRRRTLMKLQ